MEFIVLSKLRIWETYRAVLFRTRVTGSIIRTKLEQLGFLGHFEFTSTRGNWRGGSWSIDEVKDTRTAVAEKLEGCEPLGKKSIASVGRVEREGECGLKWHGIKVMPRDTHRPCSKNTLLLAPDHPVDFVDARGFPLGSEQSISGIRNVCSRALPFLPIGRRLFHDTMPTVSRS